LPIWTVELRGQVRCQRCPKVLNNGVGQRSTEARNQTKKPQSERERGQP
jgi:phage FluMu protein Com